MNFYTFSFNNINKIILVFFILFIGGISSKIINDFQYYLKYQNTLKFLSSKYNHNSLNAKIEDYLPLIYEHNKCFRYKLDSGYKAYLENGCLQIKNTKKPVVLLIGDSHSASIGMAMGNYYKNNNINFLQISSGWCTPFTNNIDNRECLRINKLIDQTIITKQPNILVVSVSWIGASKPPYNIKNMNFFRIVYEKLEQYKYLGAKEIILIGQLPIWSKMIPEMFNLSLELDRINTSAVRAEIIDFDKQMAKFSKDNNISYIPLIPYLCMRNECLITVPFTNNLIAWDESHLTEEGSYFIFTNFLVNNIKF